MFTGNLNTQNERTNNQAQPFQLATYLTFNGEKVHYGIGPYYQSPALNAQGTPKQSGAGVSYGAYYRPAHWVIGGTGYNAWGIGNNTSSGTANIFSATPPDLLHHRQCLDLQPDQLNQIQLGSTPRQQPGNPERR
jgi:hypothetical protein